MKTSALAVATAVILALPATAAADYAHVVAPGESLSSIAATDGLTVDQVAADNGLSPDAQLIAGSTVMIPPQGAAPAVTWTSGAATATGAGGYVVQPGDTLSGIAAANGMSTDDLATANGLDPNGILVSGTTLAIPGAAQGNTPSQVVDSVVAGNQTLPGGSGGPYPTNETLDASTVGSIGASAGAPSSLTQAVGWQESGFNNALVSATGAVGIMQIEPDTWNYINQVLTPNAPLSPSSASDNVRGGALLLNSLLAETGGNMSLAAAGYYQGLQSVEQNGMYADTQSYVNNVLALQSQYGGG
jgi:LysM repeat protein